MSRKSSSNDRRKRARRWTQRAPLFLVVLCFVAHFLRFGYVYGDGDQDELLPAALRLLNNDLFATDWLIQHVVSGINVRTYFVALIAAVGVFVPLWLAVAILHLVVWCATAYGVYALGYRLSRDRVAAAMGMTVAMVVTPVMTLGGNSLVHNLLVPEGVAWALILPGFLLFLKKHWVPSGVLLGFATWFHLLAGGLMALALCMVMFWRAAERAMGYEWRGVVRFALVVGACSLPAVVPVAMAMGNSSPSGESPFYIHAVFRNPHHHLFFSFDSARHIRFWPLLALGIAALWWMSRKNSLRNNDEIARFWVAVAILCAVSIVFVEWIPVEVVAKLQFFKLTVPATMLASLLVCAVLAEYMPGRFRDALKRILSFRKSGLALSLVLFGIVLGLGVRGIGRPGEVLYPLRHLESDLAEAEEWARTETDEEALFAIPPPLGWFRSMSQRSVVANWNAFVFEDAAMQTWYARLLAIAPIPRPARGSDPREALQTAYYANTSSDWERLRDEYHIDYLLVRAETRPLDFQSVFRNGEWTIYSLGETADERE